MYARQRRYLSVVLLWAALHGTVWAEELTLTIAWTEPTMLNLPDRTDSQLSKTRIQWRPWACIDQPPPGVRVEQYGKLSFCGFRSGVDVPASGPTGGQPRVATLPILEANPAWERVEIRIIPLTVSNVIVATQATGDVEYRVIELVPAGELVNPPIQLKLRQ